MADAGDLGIDLQHTSKPPPSHTDEGKNHSELFEARAVKLVSARFGCPSVVAIE